MIFYWKNEANRWRSKIGLIRSYADNLLIVARTAVKKTEVPDPLAVEDLISCKLNNKRKLARLITQYVMVIGLSGVQFGL